MKLTFNQALRQGILAYNNGNVQEADRYFTAILRVEPRHPDANYNMGILAVSIGKVEEALPFFETAITANPKMTQYRASFVDSLIKINRLDDAKNELDKALSKGLKDEVLDRLKQKINSLKSANFKSDANNLNSEDPTKEKLKSLMMLYKQRKFIWLFDETKKLIKHFPNSSFLLNLMGVSAAQTERMDMAIDAFKKAINLKKDNGEIYYNLGNALKDNGELDEAIKNYKKAISYEPNLAEAYNNIGVILKTQGKIESAIKIYKEGLLTNPNNAQLAENLYSLETQLLGTSLVLKKVICDEKKNTDRIQEKPKLQILKAINAFINGDNKSTLNYIKNFNSFDRKSIELLSAKDQIFCHAYGNFLQKLVEQAVHNSPIYQDENFIYHLGESHCLSYAHNHLSTNGLDFKIIPKITFGAKAYHFSQKLDDNFKAVTELNFNCIPRCSNIFLSFGEIDCRPDEGFILAARKLNKPIKAVIYDTVKGYVDWFAEHNKSKNHKLFFLNVPAPVFDEKYNPDMNNRVSKTIKLFNKTLKQATQNYDFELIDLYQFTVGYNGFSNKIFHIDGRHLSINAISEIEKQMSK